MEDLKNKTEQPSAPAQNGGRRRRRRHGHGGNGNNGNTPNNGVNAAANEKSVAPEKNERSGAKNGKPQPQPAANAQNANANGQNNAKKKKNNPPKQQNGQNNANRSKQKGKGEKQGNKEENRKDTYLYTLDGNLYVNLTNKCSNGCDFCVRNERTSYYGNYLWLRNGDPTAEKVMAAANGFGDLSRFKEVVFCGFGEPTYKVAEMLALCDFFHEKGLKTRLNTNGQGNLINKRDITPELKGKIDFVNVSLNASCVEKYQPICRSQFGEAGFNGLIEFAKLCKRNGVPCRFSIVDCIGEAEVEACKRLAQSVNIPLYVRAYIQDS